MVCVQVAAERDAAKEKETAYCDFYNLISADLSIQGGVSLDSPKSAEDAEDGSSSGQSIPRYSIAPRLFEKKLK